MATSRPAHVLGDVLTEHLANDGSRVFTIEIQTNIGRQRITVQSQYVLVGDELQDLYEDDLVEDEDLDAYYEGVLP